MCRGFFIWGHKLDTKTFLTRVTPQVDELVVSTHKPDPTGANPRGIFWNRGSFTDLDDAVYYIQRWDAEPNTTVYFTIGAMAGHEYMDGAKKKWRRTQECATWFKTLALDLDIGAGKPYATQQEGWAAMSAALKNIGMPGPMVISSGNGIHLYWPLTASIKRNDWVKLSTALRVALEEQHVVIDTSKIHDPSMVLRPVGTNHKKQTPWKPVECKRDCPDYDPRTLVGVLSQWVNKAPTASAPARKAGKGKSSIMDAVLNSNDVLLDAVASRCNQVGALVQSGGVSDAAGRPVEEPLWRASLGLAKHCTDPQEAIIKLAGKHPDFDLDSNMAKLDGWKGTGPTTCAKFEQLCAKGCEGCPHRGQITSPAQLSVATEVAVETPAGEEVVFTLPKGYVAQGGRVYREVETETETTDANGNKVAQTLIEHDLVSSYEMHVTGVYHDEESGKSAFKLLIKYPMEGWKEKAHDMAVIATAGKEFNTFLLDRQVYVKNIGQQEKLRGYLMDYLTMVQQQAPSGQDYTAFGWNKDGSFMCGQTIIGSPTGVTDIRLRGAATKYTDLIRTEGDRTEWVRGMAMLDRPGTETIRAAVLLSTIGLLGPAAGNAQLTVSIYSPETTTGKTLSLIAINSMLGSPKALLLNRKDTANSLYKLRGVLNHLPACIDEMTSADDKELVDTIYDLSQGRERIRMKQDGTLREPATWEGPTIVTTNISLHQKIEGVQAGSDPLKIRCLELHQHDRTFVTVQDGQARSDATVFFDMMLENNGWAFPELVAAVQSLGGPKVIWSKAEAMFEDHFGFRFEAQDRFYRTGLIGAWAIGMLGKKLGLFPFDIKGTIQYLIDHIKSTRKWEEDNKTDVFDTIGQFLAEHNDQIVEAKEKYGSNVEQVTMPAPERAVARVKIVYDDKTPIMPGSMIAINAEKLRVWLRQKRDGMDRIERALEDENALLRRRERITMFKGCPKHAPGQAQCMLVNLAHPRLADTLLGSSSRPQSKITLAVLQGAA